MPKTILIIYSVDAIPSDAISCLLDAMGDRGFDPMAIGSCAEVKNGIAVTDLSNLPPADLEEVRGVVAKWRMEYACATGTGFARVAIEGPHIHTYACSKIGADGRMEMACGYPSDEAQALCDAYNEGADIESTKVGRRIADRMRRAGVSL